MKVFLYRLSLTEESQLDLFEDGTSPVPSRKEFLEKVFTRSFSFDYRKDIKLRYEFIEERVGIIYSAVCRWIPENAEIDPKDPFAVAEGGRWKKAAFFLNVNDDQQVVGLEAVNGVGGPNPVLAGLVEAINEINASEPYRIDAFSLPLEGSFRAAVGAYPGPVTSLKFDLVVPNPTDAEGETREALKKLREKTGMDRLKEEYKSEKGLKTDGEYIQDIVEYTESGGGDVIASSYGDEIYNSKKTVRSADVSDELRPTGEPKRDLLHTLLELLKK